MKFLDPSLGKLILLLGKTRASEEFNENDKQCEQINNSQKVMFLNQVVPF